MTKRNPTLSPLAGTAIAAVLALTSTPAAAQDAAAPEPVIAAPPAAERAAAPPALETAPVLTSERVVQAIPDTPEPAISASPVPAAAAPAARAAANRGVRIRATVTEPRTSEPTVLQEPLAAPDAAVLGPAAIPAEIDPAPVAAQPAPLVAAESQNSDFGAEMGLGLLGLAAVGGAYALSRRRKAAPAAPMRAAASTPVHPLDRTAAAQLQRTETAFDRPASLDAEEAFTARADLAMAVTVPPGPLPAGPAMADLYHRMVAAAPDASNPFTSVKRRGKRARWLLKQHEYALDRQTAGTFDFRAYDPSGNLRQQQPDAVTLQHA